jgi:L-xylulokinase
MSSATSTSSGRNAIAVIGQCLDQAGIDGGDIAAIGCAGHGNGLYALDRDGAPLIGIQSLDTRATGLVDEWAEQKVSATAPTPIARQSPWAAQTPTLLAWLKRHAAGALQAASARCFCARISSSTG